MFVSIRYRIVPKEQFEKKNEAEQDNENEEILWEEGTISDLSGGGIRFHGNVECKKRIWWKLSFHFRRKVELFHFFVYEGSILRSF